MIIRNPRARLIGLVPVGCAGCRKIGVGFVVALFLEVNGIEGMTLGIIWRHA